MKKIEIVNLHNRELANIVANMTAQQFGFPIWISDTAGKAGFSVQIEEKYSELKTDARYFAMGVNAVLGRFFNL